MREKFMMIINKLTQLRLSMQTESPDREAIIEELTAVVYEMASSEQFDGDSDKLTYMVMQDIEGVDIPDWKKLAEKIENFVVEIFERENIAMPPGLPSDEDIEFFDSKSSHDISDVFGDDPEPPPSIDPVSPSLANRASAIAVDGGANSIFNVEESEELASSEKDVLSEGPAPPDIDETPQVEEDVLSEEQVPPDIDEVLPDIEETPPDIEEALEDFGDFNDTGENTMESEWYGSEENTPKSRRWLLVGATVVTFAALTLISIVAWQSWPEDQKAALAAIEPVVQAEVAPAPKVVEEKETQVSKSPAPIKKDKAPAPVQKQGKALSCNDGLLTSEIAGGMLIPFIGENGIMYQYTLKNTRKADNSRACVFSKGVHKGKRISSSCIRDAGNAQGPCPQIERI